ncbi:Uncharacterised protein [Enterobacter cloacae]|nr:Uncharacterised protein [Enterobacter cloacae]
MAGERVNDVGADRLAVLHVSFTLCLLIGDALLFGQAFLFCLFCLEALSLHCRGFFAFRPGFRFLLLACRTLFRFDALALRQLCTRFLFSFTACCGFNLCFVLRFGIAAGLFCRFALNAFFVITLSLFRLTALLFAVTVKILIHQKGQFVVRFKLGRQLLIEFDVHFQRFGVQRVHGFLSLDAFLLGFPFGEWAAGRISQLVAGINESLNFCLCRTHSLFQALKVLTSRLFDCRLAAGNLRRQRGDTVTAFLRGQVRHFVYCLADLLEISVKAASDVKRWCLLRLDFDDS